MKKMFFSSDLHKFKLQTQLKTLNHIVDEKQVEIKDAITIIPSLNASQKLLVSAVLKPIELILTVPATNAVSERSCSKFIQNLSAIIFDSRTSISSCLTFATHKEKVDKLKFVKVASQFCFKNEHCFSI